MTGNSTLQLLIMHHENMRVLYPDDNLMILCECDGALYDTRALALHTLRSFDRAHHTDFFSHLDLARMPMPLHDIDELLCALVLPFGISSAIAAWYRRHLWDMDGVRHAHQPLSGVLTILGCLQMQHHTHIGLCAERAGRAEEACASMISELCSPYGMACAGGSIFLDDVPSQQQPDRVLRAWHHFRHLGYRIIAVIDSRAEAGHAAIVNLDRAVEVLFLGAREVREMSRTDVAVQAGAGPDVRPRYMPGAADRKRSAGMVACALGVNADGLYSVEP